MAYTLMDFLFASQVGVCGQRGFMRVITAAYDGDCVGSACRSGGALPHHTMRPYPPLPQDASIASSVWTLTHYPTCSPPSHRDAFTGRSLRCRMTCHADSSHNAPIHQSCTPTPTPQAASTASLVWTLTILMSTPTGRTPKP